ncbi:MAG: ABC transporter permease [Dehalococcoidia bacterium]|nr:ABC transporter permease [Dehalococcoidia bacterium]MDW8120377.1 ABC transporter permease [Chloroflexota bacterium]
MVRFLVRRFIFMILALIGATMLVFFMSRAGGRDPRYLYAQAGGYGLSPAMWEELGRRLHLDKPLIVQYLLWLGDTMRGDLGESLMDRRPVAEKIAERIPNTLRLALAAWLFATFVGVPLGVLSAVKRGTVWDYIARAFAMMGQAAPPFWVGLMAILLFSVQLRLLPTGTMGEGIAIRNYIMPSITLGWLAAAGYLRLTRSAMLEVLDAEFIKLARAKGVSEWMVIWKHAFRNALIPPLTLSAIILAGFLAGAVVVETVFSWPGVGRLAYESVLNDDFPQITACVLVFTAGYLVLNFLTDLAYAVIDPRIRIS